MVSTSVNKTPDDVAKAAENALSRAGAVLHSPEAESRLPVVITVMSVAALSFALPQSLMGYPKWVPSVVLGVLLLLARESHRRGHTFWNNVLGNAASAATTLFLLWSVGLMVTNLSKHTESPGRLLTSAAILWTTNVVVFALWYWRMDAGGPNARERQGRHDCGAFLFPQMTLSDDSAMDSHFDRWTPHFVDYLFLSFNTSTALSPTDTAVLSR